MERQLKIIILTIFLSATFVVTDAQNLKGMFFAGGNGGLNFKPTTANINGSNYSNSKGYQSYNINLSGGYCLIDKLAIGLQMGYSFMTYTSILFEYQNNVIVNQIKSTGTYKTFSISPLLRYTIPVTDKFSFNLNLTVPYSFSESIYALSGSSAGVGGAAIHGNIFLSSGNNSPIASSSYGLNIGPGFQWFLKKSIALSGSFGSLGYNYIITKSSKINSYAGTSVISTQKTNDFKLSLSTGLNLGLTFYFGGSKDKSEYH